MPPDPTPLWGPGAVPGEWADECGSSQASRLLWKMQSTVSMVHSPFPTMLRASAQGIKAAIMRCGCTWPSLTITVTTNSEKGMSNGFSSRKDLLLTSPARKEAKQVRTKATVRFRPKRQATVRYRHNRPHVQHSSHEHKFKVHTIAVHQGPRSVTDEAWARVFVSPVVNVFPSFALHHVSFISHKSLRSWLMSAEKGKKKTYQVRDHRERCRRVSAEYGTAEEDLNECLVRMGQLIRDTAGATHALSCGTTDRDSNEARYLQEAQFFSS